MHKPNVQMILEDESYGCVYTCSRCHTSFNFELATRSTFKYCCNCGGKIEKFVE